jgi:hypothetical protein
MGNQTGMRILGGTLTAALFVVCGVAPCSRASEAGKGKGSPDAAQAAGYAPEDLAAFSQRFRAAIWPLLTRAESNCTACHTANNPSQLRFGGDPDHDFRALLADGHFDSESPTSLLGRVTALEGPTRMPPAPMKRWSDADVATLRAFVNDLYAKKHKGGLATEELFPSALLAPYSGKKPALVPDNTFLTYFQLRGKVKAIFDDEWKRDDRDLFIENLAQFGGADFVRSFNENAKPTAQFLSGVDALSKDVVSRAFLTSSGPFAGRATDLPAPLKMTAPDAAYRREINRLYNRMLFRDANPQEMQAAFNFIRGIYRSQKDIAAQGDDLRFELTARDERGLTTTQSVHIPVANDACALGQTLVNQNDNAGADDRTRTVRRKLDGPFTFKANDAEQRVTVSNVNTRGSVVVHGVEIRGPLPDGPTRLIPVTDPTVQAQGAWRLTRRDGLACYEDENQNKGASSLIIPLNVTKDGDYELTLLWRKSDGDNADNTLVEVRSHGKHRLAVPPTAPVPPKGEARFTLDMSDDTQSFADLKTAFQFGESGGVEISNANTRRRVVADAVRFVPLRGSGGRTAANGAETFLVPAKEAQGQEQWKDFQQGEYSFYKPVGPRIVSDENDSKLKGKLSLLFRPAARKAEWKPDGYYRVEIGYPGAVQNETAAPVIVHARASSPIVRIAHPTQAHVGAVIMLDAAGSYNLQGTALQFTWRQIGGAQMKIATPHAAKLTFMAPTLTVQQAAWEGLCRALMKHPDFLFTRPLSLASARASRARKRLQLVKIAQDLVARPPTDGEFQKLDKGASLTAMVDGYLNSQEFADFYFRRVRLYLESHGTDEEDEPARLWTYIALNNRPFKEILTADYTVDADWQRQPRPACCGKSGVLTMKGFIKGKPGLPHFNYAAQVCEKFLGYVFEVPEEIVKMRDGITAASTTSPSSVCYSCHKILTPLAYQRRRWTDDGVYKEKDAQGRLIDDSDQNLVASYPFKGSGMEAFAMQAQNKERFLRTLFQTHFIFYFGREMRYDKDERGLYKRLWDNAKASNYNLKSLIRTLLTSREYLDGVSAPVAPSAVPKRAPASKPQHFAQR